MRRGWIWRRRNGRNWFYRYSGETGLRFDSDGLGKKVYSFMFKIAESRANGMIDKLTLGFGCHEAAKGRWRNIEVVVCLAGVKGDLEAL